ncbi:MAG: hypothetical protein ACM3KD_07905, partial [Hyphomicrobiaceae bacterium]
WLAVPPSAGSCHAERLTMDLEMICKTLFNNGTDYPKRPSSLRVFMACTETPRRLPQTRA